MAQKKTVFERLEDKMIELEENLDTKFAQIQESIENLKNDIPRSLGESLMSFTDMIGAKVEDLEDTLKSSGTTRAGPSIEPQSLDALKKELKEIKTTLESLQIAINNLKVQPSPSPPSQPSPITTPATSTPKPQPTPPSPIKKTQPPPASSPPSQPSPGSGLAEVLKLLDSIKDKAKTTPTAYELGTEMEQTRDTIVKIFRWHPALYEFATFARRLKKAPQGTPIDTETQQLLIEKIDDWKNRLSSG
ncbi:MAG: hypothetical protein ACTSRS_08180 [Candidatus Helarchaeota archaeon]